MKKYRIVGPITNINRFWVHLLDGDIAFYYREKPFFESRNDNFIMIEFGNLDSFLKEAKDLFLLENDILDNHKISMLCKNCRLLNISVHMIATRKDEFQAGYEKYLFEFDIPLLSISSINSDDMMPLLEVNINRKFKECGFKVLQYSSFHGGSIFGLYDIMELFDLKDGNYERQIININNRLKDAIKINRPDIVVVGIPYALFRNDMYDNKNFGFYAYLISQSLCFDCNIQLIGYGNYSLAELKELSKFLKYRFEIEPDIFVVSNLYTIQTSEDNLTNYEIGIIDSNSVKRLVSNLNKSLRIYDISNTETIFNKICECLQ